MNEKKTYVAPQLIVHGSITELTQGASTGSHLDHPIPAFGDGFNLTGQLS